MPSSPSKPSARQHHRLNDKPQHAEHGAFLYKRIHLHSDLQSRKILGGEGKASFVTDLIIHQYLTCGKRELFSVQGTLAVAAAANHRAQIASLVALAEAELPKVGNFGSMNIVKNDLHAVKRMIGYNASRAVGELVLGTFLALNDQQFIIF